jgi:hypothetical protein
MPVARHTVVHRRSHTMTAVDLGGQKENKADRAKTNENTANSLAIEWRDWQPTECPL